MDTNFFHNLLKLYPGYHKVYGPYVRKDCRRIIVVYGGAVRRTISWPKALVEVREGRRLTETETVDHNNGDFTDDRSENLVVRERSEHARLDVKRLQPIKANCRWCGREVELNGKRQNSEKVGPFCNRTCSGKYGASIGGPGRKKDITKVFPKLEYNRTYKSRKDLD